VIVFIHMSPKIANYLTSVLDDVGVYSKNTLSHLQGTIAALLEKYERYGTYLTDHGHRHCEKIIENLNAILKPVKKTVDLNSMEAFVVLAAAWIHDIGYVIDESAAPNREDNHHELSADFIMQNYQTLGIRSKHVAQIIAGLCLAHRRRVVISEIFNRPKIRVLNRPVRVQFLAALLSLADAFDCAFDRAPEYESNYILRLPEKARWHWEACQLVRGIEFDHGGTRIVLDAVIEDEKGQEDVKRKVGYLQEELERVLAILAGNSIVFLYVEANCNGTTIDGRKITLAPITESRTKLETFFDLETVYRVTVVQREDCRAVRRVSFVNGSQNPVKMRRHFFYSDSSFFELDPDEPVQAWHGNERLHSKLVSSHPAKCEFDILFPKPVEPGGSFSYVYEIYWPGCFPSDEEFFTGNDYGLKVQYELVVPLAFKISQIACKEVLADGQYITLVELDHPKPAKGTTRKKEFVVEVTKNARSSNTTLSWKWERP